ncbi:Pestheic acid cluster transcriptional regulator 3-like protein [Cladobotryum mycophilum]|uniref:Pestheic acid cluster transcriptional regulator 3-like protein n=1 Tax=Cladobotryum mycophilum TaxID=491253 RepID=A0ABR0SLC1_9HYPO
MSSLRHLLSAKVRSQSGCYTCRLRRKKCDERRPECHSCAALEITCYFEDAKPDWMDGGPRQKEMAEFVKQQVKKQASQRRDRKYLELLEAGTRKVNLNGSDDAAAAVVVVDSSDKGYASTSAPSTKESPVSNISSSVNGGGSPPEAPWHSQSLAREEEDFHDMGSQANVHYTCIYLDYIFPHMFPHYRPHLLGGGRGWVLDVLRSNDKSLYYITMSLAAYYFAIILSSREPGHSPCIRKMNSQLQSQMEMGLRELQREVSSLGDIKSDPKDGLKVMESIIQLLIFEVAAGNRENWKVHLDAAIALFCQILTSPEDWTDMLRGLQTNIWPPPDMGINRPWSTNQAACRFYTANLLYVDVLSSVTLGCAPRLRNYQATIIPGCVGQDWLEASFAPGPLRMEEFRGLHNWVIQVIGDISSLYAWKKAQSQAGSLSINELITRGQDTLGYVISVPTMHEQPSYAMHNIIWLNAALIYLNTVISGWQPSSPEIQCCVTKTTDLLYNLPKGTCLGALAFPFCVAGCLASPEDEHKYREMVTKLGPMQAFGTVKVALDVIEEVWARRPLDESWDVAQCMNIQGHGVLLV